MIKISDISPVDQTSVYKSISDLETEFLKRLRVNTKPEDKLNVLSRKKAKNKNPGKEFEICQYLKTNFKNIILDKPNDLFKIIKHFESKGWDISIYKNDKSTRFGKQILEAFGYSERFRSQIGRGIWLAQQLNIKTCPYCNAQSTLIVPTSTGKSIAKFQFDHFFFKDRYPYLSISLYNLIPSCVNCNITKSTKSLNLVNHYHPYFLNFSRYFKFRLKYNPDPKKLNIAQVKKQNLQIVLKANYADPDNLVKNHNDIYHLSGVYNRHQDIAEDLLYKAIIYTQGLISGHLKIEKLFPDRSTYLKYLIGTFPATKDVLKRPLSKFAQDIANQLGLK